jgi:hypothetical protein
VCTPTSPDIPSASSWAADPPSGSIPAGYTKKSSCALRRLGSDHFPKKCISRRGTLPGVRPRPRARVVPSVAKAEKGPSTTRPFSTRQMAATNPSTRNVSARSPFIRMTVRRRGGRCALTHRTPASPHDYNTERLTRLPPWPALSRFPAAAQPPLSACRHEMRQLQTNLGLSNDTVISPLPLYVMWVTSWASMLDPSEPLMWIDAVNVELRFRSFTLKLPQNVACPA